MSLADSTCPDATLCEWGQRLSGIRGFVFDGFDSRGHRFSISISSDDQWSIHLYALLDFVQKAASVIADARTKGVTFEADVAIEPEDLQGKFYLSCSVPAGALKELQQNAVDLTFSVYAGDSSMQTC